MDSYGIYPKQYRNALLPIEKNRCFILMPFQEDFDIVYGEIKSSLISNGMICNRADEIFGSVPIMAKVLKETLKAHFVIADLTNQNANVFYELGIAHSFKDAHHIILISQNINDIPFDIRHLGAIIYDPNNLKQLTSKIRISIEENRYHFDFFEVLQKKNIITNISNDMREFIELFSQNLGKNISTITKILNRNSQDIPEESVKSILDQCVGYIYSREAPRNLDSIKGIIQIIAELVNNLENFDYSNDVIFHILNELEGIRIGKTDEEVNHLKAIFAVQIASGRIFREVALNWIIEYFSKSKTATIDLNRYHLERFLMTSSSPEIEMSIVNSVLHDNYYIREHMADMVGEKKIYSGLETLVAQLRRETNIYVTASLITAIGKLGNPSSTLAIKEWLSKNESQVVETKHFFILKHVYLALINLGVDDDFRKDIEIRFADHIGSNSIY